MQVGHFPASAANSLIEGYCDDFVSLAAILAQTLEQVSMRGLNYESSRTSLERIERGMRDLSDAIREMLDRGASGRSPEPKAAESAPVATPPAPTATTAPIASPQVVASNDDEDDFDLETPRLAPASTRPPQPEERPAFGIPPAGMTMSSPPSPPPPLLRETSPRPTQPQAPQLQQQQPPPPAKPPTAPAAPASPTLTGLWDPKPRLGRPSPKPAPKPTPPPKPSVTVPVEGAVPAAPQAPRGVQPPPLGMAARHRRQAETLKGSNQTMPLASVFQFLGRMRKSGTMHVRVDGETMAFELLAGCIHFTASDRCPAAERLGELLVELGSATPEQIAPFLEQVGVSSGDRLGKLLIDNGVVSNGQVLEALELQVQRRFQRAANHAMATYEFEEGLRQAGDGRIRIAPAELTFAPRRRPT